MSGATSGDYERAEIDRISNLEGFVWLLWRKGVIRVEDGKALVDGVDVPEQFSAHIVGAIEDCNIAQHEMWTEQAAHITTPEPQP